MIIVASTLVGEKITLNFRIDAAIVLVGMLVGALLPSKSKGEAVEERKDRSRQVLSHCNKVLGEQDRRSW